MGNLSFFDGILWKNKNKEIVQYVYFHLYTGKNIQINREVALQCSHIKENLEILQLVH